MVTITRTGGQTEDRGAELKGLSTDEKPITQASYNALPSATQSANVYLITD